MHSHTFHRTYSCLSTMLCFLLLTGMLSSRVQAQRVINDADRVTLHGNTHPLARAEFDRGSANAAMPMNNMVLLLSVRPDARAQLQQLLADQQNPHSPQYHKWLTPAEFGLRFGPTDQDIADVSNWLQKFGFRVDQLANGRMWINFSGDVQKVERAFQTNIRQYEVNGKMHHANATDPSVPRALTGLVRGVVSLNDFRKHPQSTINQLPPDFTSGTGANFLAPADFATIYDVNPLYDGSPAIDGTGQTIAIVGRTDINLADVQFFRSFFGLPANDPVFILNGPDPGNLGGNEEAEADLDVEWSGAVAKNATIDFVISQSTATTDGVDLSAQFIVNNNVANLMSTSFGLCETALGTAGNDFWNTLWQQAAAQGITALVSAGDSGAAGCDAATSTTGTGTGVNGLSSTPNNISVGGTEFNEGTATFWSPTNDPTTQASVLSYIPEVVWNESANVAGGSGLFASGGGASIIYPKPAFQAGPGVPADGARDVPDVALSSASHDGYLIIQGHSATTSGLESVGGTSAASPSFAGLMALVVQKTGTAQGNATPILYTMGQNQFAGGTAVYHDTLTGDNSVPGVTGFTAGTGYDQASGWGSVDAAALVNFWNNNATPDFTVSADPASQSVNRGVTANYTVTMTAVGGFANQVTFSISGLPTDASATFTPASLTGSGTSALAISTALTTPVGSYPLTITGSDGVISHSASITLVVTTPDFTLSATPASQTIETGSSASYTATIAPLNAYTGTVSFSVSGLPAGASATFTPASVISSGSSTLVISTTAGTTPAGNYVLTITASDGTLTHSTSVNLSVTDFTLDAAPPSQTIVVGGSATYTATLTGLNGYTGTANLSVTGLPPFATATFTPTSITGSGSSSLVIATTSNTPAAIYSLTVTASDGIETRSVPLSLEVDPKGNFSLTISPSSASVNQGQNIGYGVTVSSSGGFTAVVVLSVSGLPAGATATLNPSSVQGSGLVSLSIQTAAETPGGSYTFTVTGTSGPLVRTTTATLVVLAPDFSVSASPASQSIGAGQSTSYTVTLSPLNDYVGTVNFSVSGLPAGAGATFSPASLTTSGTSTLAITTTTATPGGSYPLTITGSDAVRTHTTAVTLVVLVPDFSLSASPASRVILVGQSTNYSVILTPVNGYSGTVSFSIAGLPAGAGATFTPASLTNSGTTTLAITTSAATPPGTYPLAISGSDGTLTRTTSVSLEVDAVPAADFTIAAPATITVKRNSAGSETVTITGVNGFAGTVNLSISGVPNLVTASFTPASVTGSGTSTLTFLVDHRAQQGIYPLTVTGTSGLLVHSTNVTLTVN
ncbi:MAG TPA: protease pro-enzyme activation domain-containing protein [Verrucomicrobiae bacterium]|nr:protease pro-enzyme activation domain-containing protein [Verrucomicrobiae bacterium]